MSNMPTEVMPAVQQPTFISRVQRFFEDWWPVLAISMAAIVTGLVVTMFVHQPDNQGPYRFCREAHGHIVRTGVSDQLACVDDGWKLVTP